MPCCVYALTLKLTAGLILILVIKPAISGWLLYPLPQLDLFSVDWKISVQKAAADAAEIKVCGRGLYDACIGVLHYPVYGDITGYDYFRRHLIKWN